MKQCSVLHVNPLKRSLYCLFNQKINFSSSWVKIHFKIRSSRLYLSNMHVCKIFKFEKTEQYKKKTTLIIFAVSAADNIKQIKQIIFF